MLCTSSMSCSSRLAIFGFSHASNTSSEELIRAALRDKGARTAGRAATNSRFSDDLEPVSSRPGSSRRIIFEISAGVFEIRFQPKRFCEFARRFVIPAEICERDSGVVVCVYVVRLEACGRGEFVQCLGGPIFRRINITESEMRFGVRGLKAKRL